MAEARLEALKEWADRILPPKHDYRYVTLDTIEHLVEAVRIEASKKLRELSGIAGGADLAIDIQNAAYRRAAEIVRDFGKESKS